MTDQTIVPSSIHPETVPLSSFGRGQTECAAMCVVNYLRDGEYGWDHEFTYWDFSGWAGTGLGINDLYLTMARMEGGVTAFVVEGLNGLIERGYITRDDRDGQTHMKVTDSFVQTISRFAAS